MKFKIEKILKIDSKEFENLIKELEIKIKFLKENQGEIYKTIANGWKQDINNYKGANALDDEQLIRLNRIIEIVS